MGHTPGPWRIAWFADGKSKGYTRIVGPESQKVCDLFPFAGEGGVGADESSNNARLIVAASSLLECLETLKWKSVEKDNMEFECRTTCYVMDKIKAAIADAKGQDSSIYRGLPEQTQKALRDEKDEE